jgi:hypothetical protein
VADTIEEKIEAALFGHVRDLELTGLGADDIAWPNLAFEPSGPYVRVRHFVNTHRRLFLKGSAAHLRQGILQLTVFAPLNGGVGPALLLAGEIADQSPADLALYGDGIKVRVQQAPDVGSADKTDAHWFVPVSIRYEVFA